MCIIIFIQSAHHRNQKAKWLEEAKESYLAADNLHPPGITVPAKLAFAHMEVGNLIDAFTVLTDLKNNVLYGHLEWSTSMVEGWCQD